MIKLIIFDLDGVLVETKDLHFHALNKALIDFNECPISYEDHLYKYDGKPTKDKLALKGISAEKHSFINNKKQEYTKEMLESSIKENSHLIDLFRKLKAEDFILHVASNSIRKTVEIVLLKLGILYLTDLIMSNEDVVRGKPHPEMYLKCMLTAGVGPKETIIIEDSYVGRTGAYNSGAFLYGVKDSTEVTYDLIKSTINKFSGHKSKWKDSKLNIVIPMAGAGSRFVQAGYTFPKPLIEVNGKPMIQVVIENINIDANYIYLVRKEHYDKYNLKYLLELLTPQCKIVQVDELTEGAACTVLLAKEYININAPLLIANSDQFIKWDSSHFMYSAQTGHLDGSILTFYNTHPKWSFVKVNMDGFVTEVREKVPISTEATVGIYYWSKGKDFVRYAEQMIARNIRVNNEFYVAPVYNEAIEENKRFKTYRVDEMYGLGTPVDLDYFIQQKIIV